ncbi:MAG: hypothetical protein R3181_05320 [Rubricoccaceae bacterium]|nr:hypothetical protein [Rubricoccaceae bacterium]
MRMLFRIALLLCCCTVVGCSAPTPSRPDTVHRTYPDTLDLHFRDMWAPRWAPHHHWRDTTAFNTHALVSQVETCPRCLTAAPCDPCPGDWIAAMVPPPPETALMPRLLLIRVNQAGQFREEGRYAFSLRPHFAFNAAGDTLLQYTLLGYTPLSR